MGNKQLLFSYTCIYVYIYIYSKKIHYQHICCNIHTSCCSKHSIILRNAELEINHTLEKNIDLYKTIKIPFKFVYLPGAWLLHGLSNLPISHGTGLSTYHLHCEKAFGLHWTILFLQRVDKTKLLLNILCRSAVFCNCTMYQIDLSRSWCMNNTIVARNISGSPPLGVTITIFHSDVYGWCIMHLGCTGSSVQFVTPKGFDGLTLPEPLSYLQYIPRNMHTVFALLCFVVVIHWLIFPYPSGLLHWHWGNRYPVPAKQPWWIWINTSCEFIMNDCVTTTKQSTTKPCAYFLG